jgi:hypothetical protein
MGNYLTLEKVRIPPGFTQIKQDPILSSIPQDKIRWLNNKIAFLFDPKNLGYLAFMKQCKDDTKHLAKYLHIEASERDLSVWLKRSRIPGSKKHFRKMSFLIRPPYFSTNMEKNKDNRMQLDENRDNFILHFDQNHILQKVRYWHSSDRNINYFRTIICSEIGKKVLN